MIFSRELVGDFARELTPRDQTAGFEFRHQMFDLLAASPLPNANLSDFRHADSASKTRPRR